MTRSVYERSYDAALPLQRQASLDHAGHPGGIGKGLVGDFGLVASIRSFVPRRQYDSAQANYDSAVTQIFVASCC
jgi:hypothetical protein